MRYLIAAILGACLVGAQFPPDPTIPRRDKDDPARLPNGKIQSEEILKEEHEKSLKEVNEMRKLINEFCDEFEKSDRHVVSVQTLKKLEEIEKRAKRIRGRLTRG